MLSGDHRRRVALLGGSFDPPHVGHLEVARAAQERLRLNEILLAPTGLQPFKRDGSVARFADRLAMTELLCAEEPKVLRATAMDAPHEDGSPNYTIEVLEEMQRCSPEARLFVILGADSFAELSQWRDPERLLRMAEWIVVSRPGSERATEQGARGRVHWIDNVVVPIASRELRALLRQGKDCSGAIPPAVLGYIRARGLYEVVDK